MDRSTEIELVRRIFEYLDTRSTAMMDGVHLEPVTAYESGQRAHLERQHLFFDQPLVLAQSGDLAQPGDFLTHDLTGVPIALVRTPSGRVHAFLNVCRHRGAKVIQGSGCARTFACPYHAWTYDCEGRLLGMGTTRGFESVDRESHGLTPLPAVERHGLIWVRPTPGESFDPDTLLDGLGRELGGFGWSGYHHYETRTMRRRMNWKLAVDTFLESWHVAVLHRRTVALALHSGVGVFDQFGRNLRVVFPLKSIDALRGRPEAEWALIPHALIVHVVFPNTVLVMANDHLESWRIFPARDEPGECVLQVSLYTSKPADTADGRREWDRRFALLLGTVDAEDFAVAEAIQRGLAAGAQTHFTFGRHEPALAHFHRAVARELRIDTIEAVGRR
jgi:phenylpropionate dioxygenase-like ring-hydroxylating dioxygenase large terminal subunit